jgi:SAM-dependent methyltransferase
LKNKEFVKMLPSKESSDVLHPSREEAEAIWARRVRANREQAEHFREAPERPDFYAPTAHIFRADPRRMDDPSLDILCSLVQPGETWLDIGAGGGRYALPLALRAKEVVAVEPSQAMRSNLRQGMADYGINNIRIIEGRWPLAEPPQVDVAMMAHVGYDIEDIGSFLGAMEASARRLCVAVMLDRAPTVSAEFIWPQIHGEKRAPLPSLREFLVLQIARGRLFEIRLTTTNNMPMRQNRELMPSFLRQQLFIEPGGEKDRLLTQLLEKRTVEQSRQAEPARQPFTVGIISWTPPR